MTEHEPLKIIVLCRSWREIDSLLYEIASHHPLIAINFARRRIVTKNNDVIMFYCRESKLNDGIRADVIVIDKASPTKFELAILKYSRLYKDSMAEAIWSYQDLNNYLEATK